MPFAVNERGLYVWVDKGSPRFKCTVITGLDGTENVVCGKPFWDEVEFVRHATHCARVHEGEIEQAAPSQRLPFQYGPDAGIPDVEQWLDRTDAGGVSNRQKAIEGSKKL